MKTSDHNKTAAVGTLGLSLDSSRLSRVCLSDRRLRLVGTLNFDLLTSGAGPNSLHEEECFCENAAFPI